MNSCLPLVMNLPVGQVFVSTLVMSGPYSNRICAGSQTNTLGCAHSVTGVIDKTCNLQRDAEDVHMTPSINSLLGWKDYLHIRGDKVRGDSDYFCARAQELRELLSDLLSAGLSEGAEAALTDLCEGDVVDFCITQDLAAQVDIPDVVELPESQAAALSLFLEHEPWHSLVVDTHINVCLAMLRAYGEDESATMWHMGDPHILRTLSDTFERVDREQLGRLAAEINSLAGRVDMHFDQELKALVVACGERACQRLRVAPVVLFA